MTAMPWFHCNAVEIGTDLPMTLLHSGRGRSTQTLTPYHGTFSTAAGLFEWAMATSAVTQK
jgi:hypothetical protein